MCFIETGCILLEEAFGVISKKPRKGGGRKSRVKHWFSLYIYAVFHRLISLFLYIFFFYKPTPIMLPSLVVCNLAGWSAIGVYYYLR